MNRYKFSKNNDAEDKDAGILTYTAASFHEAVEALSDMGIDMTDWHFIDEEDVRAGEPKVPDYTDRIGESSDDGWTPG